MCGKKVINIWLAFGILGLEMNFDNFIGVTCILCWNISNFKLIFQHKMQVTPIKLSKFISSTI